MSGVMSEALKVSEIHLHSPSLHNAQWENKRGQVDIHFRSQNKQFGGGFGLLRPNLHLETCTHVFTLKQGSFNHQEY